MEKVKGSMKEALEKADEVLAKALPKVMRAMIGIATESEDDRAKVSAGSKLLDFARPPKPTGPLVALNLPTVVSALHLPDGSERPLKGRNPKAIEAQRVAQKILPEPNPLHQAGAFKSAPFQAENVLAASSTRAPTPAALTAKAREPHSPDKPPSASSIKSLPLERE